MEISIRKISELIRKLKTGSFKDRVMKEAKELFYMEGFDGIMDSNSNLIAVHNGVIEVLSTKAIFREGKPEDYLSRCTPVHYRKDYTWEHPKVKELMSWISKVFVDKELKSYFLKFCASCLKGRNSDKIFPIWSGDGDNSKSMIIKLFEATFSCYCIKIPVTAATGKRAQSSSATPEIARSKNARVAFLQEPDNEETLRACFIKEISGGDSFFGRMLHDNGGDIQVTFKIILVCNSIPLFVNPDKAVRNRAWILPFLSTWSVDAPEDEKEQFKARVFPLDTDFENTIPSMTPAFMWVCLTC